MKKLLLLPLILFIPINNVSAELQHLAETGFIVENKIEVAADVATSWKAFVEEVDNWWPKDHSWWLDQGTFTIDPRAGGCFCERAGDGRSAEHMRVSFVDPEKMLTMTGGLGPLQGMGMFGALTFTFTESDGGTVVTMTYKVNGINPDGFEELAPVVDMVQGLQIGGLKTFLESN